MEEQNSVVDKSLVCNERAVTFCKQIFIGDISYVLRDDLYESWQHSQNFKHVIKNEKNVISLCARTIKNDCICYDNHNEIYGLDSGIFGVTNMKFKNDISTEDLNKLGKVINIPSGKCGIKFKANNGNIAIIIKDKGNDSILYECQITL